MRFSTRKAAERWRKLQPFPRGHKSVKTMYFSLKTFDNRPCWAVIYDGYLRRLFTTVIYDGYLRRLFTTVIYDGYLCRITN